MPNIKARSFSRNVLSPLYPSKRFINLHRMFLGRESLLFITCCQEPAPKWWSADASFAHRTQINK